MHRDFFSARPRCWLLLGAALLAGVHPTGVRAAVVSSPYVVTVPAADPTAAAQDAMRVELVRLTGRREAVTDPALAPIVDVARQYVQIERSTTSGQIQVLFDAAALRAAIEATGRTIWDLNRPLLWISLPVVDATTDRLLRGRLASAAEERGLPVVIAAPMAGVAMPVSPAAPTAAAAPVPAGAPAAALGPAAAAAVPPAAPPGTEAVPVPMPNATELLEAAHRAGASAALMARVDPATP